MQTLSALRCLLSPSNVSNREADLDVRVPVTCMAGRYGANESLTGDCENLVPNGGLGRQTFPIKVSTCTSDWKLA